MFSIDISFGFLDLIIFVTFSLFVHQQTFYILDKKMECKSLEQSTGCPKKKSPLKFHYDFLWNFLTPGFPPASWLVSLRWGKGVMFCLYFSQNLFLILVQLQMNFKGDFFLGHPVEKYNKSKCCSDIGQFLLDPVKVRLHRASLVHYCC